MAEAEGLKKFLKKRGFDAEVEKLSDDRTYVIKLHSKTVEEVEALLAQIEEPGRFIVSILLSDITNLLVEESGLPERMSLLEETVGRNDRQRGLTEEELKRQSRQSIVGVYETIDELKVELQSIGDRLKEIELKKPWWKKW